MVTGNGDGAPDHEITHAKKAAFLAAFVELGTVTHAARAAKMDRHSHYDWLKADALYAAAFTDAQAAAIDSLEREAIRRATTGIDEPVFHQGKQVATVKKYSDVLLIFLLKGANPTKYRERQSIDHTTGGAPLFRTVQGVDPSRI